MQFSKFAKTLTLLHIIYRKEINDRTLYPYTFL